MIEHAGIIPGTFVAIVHQPSSQAGLASWSEASAPSELEVAS